MTNKKYGTGTKIAAFIMFLILAMAAFASLVGVVYATEEGYYSKNKTFYDSSACRRITYDYASDVYDNYFRLTQIQQPNAQDQFEIAQYQQKYSDKNTNFFFSLRDEQNNTLLTNYNGQKYGVSYSYSFSYELQSNDEVSENEEGAHRYTINCYVRNPIIMIAQDNYAQSYELFNTLIGARYMLIFILVITSIMAFVLFIFLMCASGHRKNNAEIVLGWQHRVPLDIYAAGLIFVFYATAAVLTNLDLSLSTRYGLVVLLPFGLFGMVVAAVVMGFLMTLAARVKKGRWWENTVIFRLIRLPWGALRYLVKTLKEVIAKLPIIWKAALLIAFYLFTNMILTLFVTAEVRSLAGLILLLFFNLCVFAIIANLALQMKSLKFAAEKIAAGDYEYKVEMHSIWSDIRQHTQTLNNISNGMSLAVSEQLKSERLKTELITNVSHDIKTPLTSIMNYIDLLKREQIDNEIALDYIAVLDRQSMKLKKLTDDLLEASRASTGNIKTQLERTDLVELVNQALGEYSAHFEEAQLEAVIRAQAHETFVLADGKLTWRVFDNLLKNICHYAQQKTRVYITIEESGAMSSVTLMNISLSPLNISAEELQERFVRGDISRSTEGSGLGLSIVKSLMELQQGQFELAIEGDLFKVKLSFKCIE